MADDNEGDKRLSYPVGLSLTQDEGAQVAAIATTLDRPVAYVTRVLVREALAARARGESTR